MPRWLQMWLALSLGTLWAIAIYATVPYMVGRGEPEFDSEDRYILTDLYPGGTFDSNRLYRVCDGGTWMYINARFDRWYQRDGGCVKRLVE